MIINRKNLAVFNRSAVFEISLAGFWWDDKKRLIRIVTAATVSIPKKCRLQVEECTAITHFSMMLAKNFTGFQ
jgi:hypothetical protein